MRAKEINNIKTEYDDLLNKYIKLEKHINEYEKTDALIEEITPINILKEQLRIMDSYLKILEHRIMRYEGIN